MSPAAARRFVAEHPTACLRFRSDGAGRMIFERRRLAVLAAAATLAGCAAWLESDELAAPPDAPADDDEPAIPNGAEPARSIAESSRDAAAPVDPDPPTLTRAERPVPSLSRRELRELRRRFRSRGRVIVTMGR
jgi:hypothetical protein